MTTVERHEDSLTVANCWTYEWGARKRPFIHPLATPAGHVLTRNAPEDHPWHHGLWFTIKFVDDDNFWEEMAPYGVLRHDGEPAVAELDDGVVSVAGTLTWTRPDRETVAIREARTWTHVPLGADAYAIDLDTSLTPTTDLRIDRTEFTTWGGYGGLAFRGRADLVDTALTLSDGSTHDRVLGVPSQWCDLTGTIDGAVVGIAVLDHPSNPRYPSPYYGSNRSENYGEEGWSNFFNAAFLFHEGMDLRAGEPLRIRHRVVVHDGPWTVEALDAAHHDWSAP